MALTIPEVLSLHNDTQDLLDRYHRALALYDAATAQAMYKESRQLLVRIRDTELTYRELSGPPHYNLNSNAEQ